MPNHFHWLIYTKEEACRLSKGVKPRPSLKIGDTYEVPPILGHPHLDHQQNLNHSIGILLYSYSKAINKQNGWTGSLFRKGTHAKNGISDDFIAPDNKGLGNRDFTPSENDYALTCFNYIHQNPVKANLAIKAEDWKYSSAKDYAGLRNGTLCNQKLAKKLIFNTR